MKKLLVANFKMNSPEARGWKINAKKAEVVVCPAFPFLSDWDKKGAQLGAQDVFWENVRSGGAYTGEVSAEMLKSFGVKYVIIGHSERRANLGETDEVVNKKMKTALAAGLKVILCVGESKEVRKKGIKFAENFVRQELRADFAGVKNKFLDKIAVAYEPIWAIGTGVADTPAGAEAMAEFIKRLVKVKVLYGGSVNSKNAGKFLNQKGIDGALVGGASLNSNEFQKIIDSV